MRIRDGLKSLFLSWDFIAALAIAVLAAVYFAYNHLSYEAAKEVFSVSVSVLSIVFSVFFAALAVLITAGDNAFVRWLQEGGLYKQIIWQFKATLLLLFVALVLSIGLFVTVLPFVKQPGTYPQSIMFAFSFIAPYALFAAINSSLNAIKYAEYRAMYILATEDEKGEVDDP